MAEIKNSFLKSKMNKDLDDRLLPSGEYRDARNISVGKSEDDDIGALETVLGNIPLTNLDDTSLKCIGTFADESRKQIYVFYTDYIGTSLIPGETAQNYIYIFKPSDNTFTKIVEGKFLNFHKDFPISGINLLEELLFFTDDRNQPRKINITRRLGYYTLENQISVAKYNPYKPIELVQYTTATATGVGTTNPNTFNINFLTQRVTASASNASNIVTLTAAAVGQTVPPSVGDLVSVGTFCYVTAVIGNVIYLSSNQSVAAGVTISFYPGLLLGSRVVCATIPYNEYDYVTGFTAATGTVGLGSYGVTSLAAGEVVAFVKTTMSNETTNTDWPGDPKQLEDKFVRFSYRFQFDDGEYSIIAPYTQIAFVPKQQGFFISGNQEDAFRSSILAWMENNIQNVELIVPLPDQASNLGTENGSTYKIKAIDLIYKEANSLSTKVLETVPISTVNCGDCIDTKQLYTFTYRYQSRKPYRTLPTVQTTRVFDKVPVRALAQATSGNRIIYGNFWDQHTPPNTLSYRVGVSNKLVTTPYKTWAEYPNHSLKQNRTYQVGFILADKWGRQSSVLLSSVDKNLTTENGVAFGGSTIYNPYDSGVYVNDNLTTTGFGISFNAPTDPAIEIGMIVQGGGIALADNVLVTGFTSNTTISTNKSISVAASKLLYFNKGVTADWPGNTLNISVDSPITSGIINTSVSPTPTPSYPNPSNGEPGLYAIPTGTGTGMNALNANIVILNKGGTSSVYSYAFTPTITAINPVANVPNVGDYLRGEEIDYTEIYSRTKTGTRYVFLTYEKINQRLYSAGPVGNIDNKYGYKLNPTGWYSYKVVVKQQEQEYYNVFLPGIISGYPQQVLGALISKPGVSEDNGFTFLMTAQPSNPFFSTKNQRVQVGMLASSTQIGTPPSSGEYEATSTVIVNKDQTGLFSQFTTSSPTSITLPGETITFKWPENPVAFPIDPIGETANIVLINDNVNKIPRDLVEVGPLQRQFRSSEQLFARVNNNDVANNTQWFPGKTSDTAISIASGSDSNFTEVSIPDFEIQGIYQFDSNPLICRISVLDSYTTVATNTRTFSDPDGADIMTFASAPSPPIIPGMIISWNKSNAANNTLLGSEGEIFNEGTIFGVVTAVNSPTEIVAKLALSVQYQNGALNFTHTKGYPLCAGPARPKGVGFASWDFMQPTLAVYETEPVDSLLDLYWESSTAGLISDLNSDVLNGFDGSEAFSPITFVLNESMADGTDLTNSFNPLYSNGNDIANTSINMQVADGRGVNRTGDFTLVSTPVLNGTTTYKIKSNTLFTYVHDSFVNDVFTFTMVVSILGGAGQGTVNTILFDGSLSNIVPAATNGTITSPINTTKDFVGVLMNSNFFVYTNGSIDHAAYFNGLRFTIDPPVAYFAIDPYSGALSKTAVSPAFNAIFNVKIDDAWDGSTLGQGSKQTSFNNFQVNIT